MLGEQLLGGNAAESGGKSGNGRAEGALTAEGVQEGGGQIQGGDQDPVQIERSGSWHAGDCPENVERRVDRNFLRSESYLERRIRLAKRPKTPFTFKLGLITLFATLTGMLMGYDLCVIAVVLAPMVRSLNFGVVQKQLVVALVSPGAMVGSLAGGTLSDALGRRAAILLSDLFFVMGAAFMAIATEETPMYIGRVCIGVGVGIGFAVVANYISEVAPPDRRGPLVLCQEISQCVGCLLAYGIGWAVEVGKQDPAAPAEEKWRWLLGAAGIGAVIQALGLFALPESPRWWIAQGRRDKAAEVLLSLGVSASASEEMMATMEAEIETSRRNSLAEEEGEEVAGEEDQTAMDGEEFGETDEAQRLEEAGGLSRFTVPSSPNARSKKEKAGGLPKGEREGNSGPLDSSPSCGSPDPACADEEDRGEAGGRGEATGALRVRMRAREAEAARVRARKSRLKVPRLGPYTAQLFVAIGCSVCQNFTFANAVLYYSIEILTDLAGICNESLVYLAGIGIGVAKIIGTVTCASLVEKWGRRKLLIVGSMGMAFCQLLFCVSFLIPVLQGKGGTISPNFLQMPLERAFSLSPTIGTIAYLGKDRDTEERDFLRGDPAAPPVAFVDGHPHVTPHIHETPPVPLSGSSFGEKNAHRERESPSPALSSSVSFSEDASMGGGEDESTRLWQQQQQPPSPSAEHKQLILLQMANTHTHTLSSRGRGGGDDGLSPPPPLLLETERGRRDESAATHGSQIELQGQAQQRQMPPTPKYSPKGAMPTPSHEGSQVQAEVGIGVGGGQGQGQGQGELSDSSSSCGPIGFASGLTVASMIIFMFFWNLSWAGLMFVVASEVLPNGIRGFGMGLVICSFWLLAFVGNSTMLSLFQGITTPGTFGLYAACGLVVIWFTWRYIPETMGKSLEEITQFFQSGSFDPRAGGSGGAMGGMSSVGPDVGERIRLQEAEWEASRQRAEAEAGEGGGRGTARVEGLRRVQSVGSHHSSLAESERERQTGAYASFVL